VIGSGLSFLNVGQININTASPPVKFLGIFYGVNTLFRFIGSAIGPAVAGMLMQTNQISINTAATTAAAAIGTAYGDNNVMTLASAGSCEYLYLHVHFGSCYHIFINYN
jgi:hypothetical protein